MIAPLMPAFANLHAAGNHGRFQALYEDASRIACLIGICSFGFLAIFADRLIVAWTANAYPMATWTVSCMSAAFLALLLTRAGTASLRARGTIRLEMSYGLLIIGLLAVLFGPSYWLWGYQGVVLAIATSVMGGSVWFIVAFARRESLGVAHYLRETLLRPVRAMGPVVGFTAVLHPLLTVQIPGLGKRMQALVDVSAWGALFLLLSVVAVWLGVLAAPERAWLISRLPWRADGGQKVDEQALSTHRDCAGR